MNLYLVQGSWQPGRRPSASGWGAVLSRLPAFALLTILVLVPTITLQAYESDQYSNRLLPIADSMAVLDTMVNDELEAIASEWVGERDDVRFAKLVYKRLGGFAFKDRLEKMAIDSPAVEKLPQEGRRGIFSGMPIWKTGFIGLFGVSPTVKVNGVLIGTDKLTHFISHGARYHLHLRRGWSYDKILRRGSRQEHWFFGGMTTGTFSNADLVANYEGLRFYRSLFRDGVVRGKPAILSWQGERVHIERTFTFGDHVNPYWDEALNPPRFSRFLSKSVRARLTSLCPDYWSNPEKFVLPDGLSQFRIRYAALGMRESPSNGLDRVCGDTRVVSVQPRSDTAPAAFPLDGALGSEDRSTSGR